MDISDIERSRDTAAASNSSKRVEERRQRTPILDVTSSKCTINVRVNTIQQRKGKAEDKDPEVLLPEKLLLKSSVPKRRERIRLAKKIDLRFGATRRELVVATENALIGILRTANTSRRRNVDWERTVSTPTPKAEDRSTYF